MVVGDWGSCAGGPNASAGCRPATSVAHSGKAGAAGLAVAGLAVGSVARCADVCMQWMHMRGACACACVYAHDS